LKEGSQSLWAILLRSKYRNEDETLTTEGAKCSKWCKDINSLESNSISNWYEAEGKHTHWLQDLVGFYQFQTFAMQCGGDGGVD